MPGVELTEDQYNDRKKRANRPSLRPEEGKKVIFFSSFFQKNQVERQPLAIMSMATLGKVDSSSTHCLIIIIGIE